MRIRSYSRMSQLDTFLERYQYLKLGGEVGAATFGFDRYLNQKFYTSREWRSVRNEVIVRDSGCDLGSLDFPIRHDLLIHHMNPVTVDQIISKDDDLINPNFLITTSKMTHNAIHYGDETLLAKPFVERRPGDTKLW